MAVALIVFFAGVWVNVHYTLPDQADPAVRADAARAATAVATFEERRGRTGVRCAARLLGRDEGALLVHAVCADSGTPVSSSSVPYRVESGGTVRAAADGDRFDESVKDLFGWRLANWYLNHQGSFTDLRP